jgi:hypothetical protein
VTDHNEGKGLGARACLMTPRNYAEFRKWGEAYVIYRQVATVAARLMRPNAGSPVKSPFHYLDQVRAFRYDEVMDAIEKAIKDGLYVNEKPAEKPEPEPVKKPSVYEKLADQIAEYED